MTNMECYGYVRVSAKDQNPERQLLAMQEQNIKKRNIYWTKCQDRIFPGRNTRSCYSG